MAESPHRHHSVDYIEIPVVDVAAAKQFYGSAFGGSIVNGPYEFPGGRRFEFSDPSGNELGVWAAQS